MSQPRSHPGFSWGPAAWWTALAATTTLGVVAAGQGFAIRSLERQDPRAGAIAAFTLISWWFWAPAARAVHAAATRWPLQRTPRTRAVLRHLGLALLLAVLHGAVSAGLYVAIQLDGPATRRFTEALSGFAFSRLQGDLFMYAALLALYWALALRADLARRMLREAELQGALAQAELAVLRRQLDPHFLFNTIHAIRTLVPDRPETARAMLLQLGDLLRASLADGRAQEVTLGEELALLRCYLAIEATRFADRLQVQIEVPEALHPLLVPSLVLQPLAENAIRHGVAQRREGGTVTVVAYRDGDQLTIEVRNPLPSEPPGASDGQGIGVRTTRARLTRLYGGAGRLSLVPGDGVMRAQLQLPARRAHAV